MASSKNIGDQIFNAVQNAVDSQDFSNLQSTIEKSIGIAAEGIARGLSSASDGIRRGQEQYALAQAKKRREEQMATIYAEPQRTTQRWHRARRLGRRFERTGPRWHNFHDWRRLNSCGKHSCCGDGRRRRSVRDGH